MIHRRRLLAALCAAGTGSSWARQESDPLRQPAQLARTALAATLLDIAAAGSRLVAVGERGTVLVSDDAGIGWRQAVVPVSVTLTAVMFSSPRLGWAVGHGGTVLHSDDGGAHWRLQLDGRQAAALAADEAGAGSAAARRRAKELVDDGADKPLLDLHVDADGRTLVVVGAYGLCLSSIDGGAHWTSWIDRMGNPRSLHLNAVHADGRRLTIAGEQGLLLHSTDAGQHFETLASPYQGSWFAASGLGTEGIVVAGLRGQAWWSLDGGRSFARSQVPLPVSFSAITPLAGGALLFINQAGMLLASRDGARTLRPVSVSPGPPLTAVVVSPQGGLVAATFAGPRRLDGVAL